MKVIIVIGLGVGVALLAAAVVFLAGMRSKTPFVIDAVRRFNRALTNPRVLRSAGERGASASVVRHVGRTTGQDRETPIGAMPVDGGFLVALPYGSRADWVKNVLASGAATIVHEGVTSPVDGATVVATSKVAEQLPPSERRLLRLFKVDTCLSVRHPTD